MTKDQNPHLALRITVESGGCHGFQYLMSLTSVPPIDPSTSQPLAPDAAAQGAAAEELKLDEDDTVFEGEQGAKVVMDGPSLELLKGSKVDYTMELIGSQFKIVDNPLATSSCGCGTSFDIKA
jgi:Fe-S cluster assembly iron-binding protein IscA